MLGSINAAPGHFRMAADDLRRTKLRWPGLLPKLITNRHDHADFAGRPFLAR
jgi:hypothetical protein